MTTTETRCEKTDLYTSQCFHCRPAAAPTIESSRLTEFGELLARSQMGKWFHANYDGTCSVCGEAFEEGDEIRADGSGGWQGRYCCAEED
jgi:hypothetical protein